MWIYNNEEVTFIDESVVGFVYVITNLLSGRKYVGKKLTTSARTRLVKGKKKKTRVESDWRNYWSSSEELKHEITIHGKENFKREILRFCYSKSECNYFELREQIIRDVLLKPEYINSFVGTRIHKKHLRNVSLVSPTIAQREEAVASKVTKCQFESD